MSSLLLGSVALTACEDFLDVNENPNYPKSVGVDIVTPSGQGTVAYIMGNQFQVAGNFWAQHFSQSLVANQYKNLDKYQITESGYDGPWQTLYAGALNDFKYVKDRAKGDSVNYAAMAGIMQAYTFQVLTDGFDKVPFTDALKGLGNTSPKFDEGPVVYDGIIKLIDDAVAQINDDNEIVHDEDLVFQGDMEKWRRFANTLKLRVYIRQIYARPEVSEAGIRALYASGAEFLEADEDASVQFEGTTSRSNPLYQTDVTGTTANNIAASQTIIDYLVETQDPRIDYLFQHPGATPNPNSPHRGIQQGLAGIVGAPTTALTSFSRPNYQTGGIFAKNAPVILMSGVESLFLQAEAAARGLATGATAKSLYEQAITASFNKAGVTDAAEVNAFLEGEMVDYDNTSDLESKIDRIITQKWVALGGTQGFEIWSELRRTGYPSFIEPSISSILPDGVIANRFLYPLSESQRNPNYPGLVRAEVPVWWDKRN
ncbi:SusD/RagB family nutrient-binding outer membrane lipoprotein [Hymenobacter sp. BT18]|uniref:SusD/RagB family nutrient-binding outer membrane lipoprotein n=1 Tax=Hymenobacter sp. BT18 TaxID=2835648 RepID=UPI001E629099|nr:SusD/RagB family nutrient-binding outer membrane lipoprotein [Hymenobacter sp. BT18]